jgi:hypothetical protein
LLQEYVEPALELEVNTTLLPEQKVVAPPAVIVAVGKSLTVTAIAVLADEIQLFTFLTCTVCEPVVETVIEAVVAPLLQRYDEPSLAVKTTLPPEQKVVTPPAVIVGVDGKVLTVTGIAVLAAEIQLFAFLTCTVCEPVAETVIEAVVAPLLQRYDEPSLAVKTTLTPEQKVVSPPAVIVGVDGKALTVTAIAVLAAEIQLFAFLTCTVGEDVVETVIEGVVAPLLQRYDEPSLAVKTTLPPEQKVVTPPAVIVGVDGKALTVTRTLSVLVQPVSVIVPVIV